MGGADGLQLPPGPSPRLHLPLAARRFGCAPARLLRRAAAAGGSCGGGGLWLWRGEVSVKGFAAPRGRGEASGAGTCLPVFTGGRVKIGSAQLAVNVGLLFLTFAVERPPLPSRLDVMAPCYQAGASPPHTRLSCLPFPERCFPRHPKTW